MLFLPIWVKLSIPVCIAEYPFVILNSIYLGNLEIMINLVFIEYNDSLATLATN